MCARRSTPAARLLVLFVPLVALFIAAMAAAPGVAQAGSIACPESARITCGQFEGDFCPGDLNPGFQEFGTTCSVAPPEPVDACPDALNPGNQPVGTTCVTAPAAEPAQPSSSNLGPATDPAVDVNHDPTLGNGPAVVDGIDTPEVVIADVAGINSSIDGGGADGVNGVANGVSGATTAGTTTSYSGSLPYTGLGLGTIAFAGLLALLLGGLARRDATRVARARC